MKTIALLCLPILPFAALPATAQVDGSCAPADVTMPACFAGSWIGVNTIGERVRAMLEAMAPASVSRSVFPDDYSSVIGLIIYPDGFYVAPPFRTGVTYNDIEEGGEFTSTQLNFASEGGQGWIWTEGSQLNFCSTPGLGGMLSMSATSSGGSASTDVAVPGGAPTFVPDISYTCNASQLIMNVALPAPIGTVTHYFNRVPSARFGDYLREFDDERYAIPDDPEVTPPASE